jgi:putative PIN family toxin of toxin-antitoxin system
MKVVLDTNVIVSGLLSPFGAPGEIVRLVSSGLLTVCHDARIIAEYREVLVRPKFAFDEELVEQFLDQVSSGGQAVVAEPLRGRLPDPEDEVFLAVALVAEARCLVTGNVKHFPRAARKGMEVVSPRAFLELYRREG